MADPQKRAGRSSSRRAIAALREALAPGGVLVILGVYRQRTPADYAVSLAAAPVNAAARVAVAAWEQAEATRRGHAGAQQRSKAPVRLAQMTLGQMWYQPGSWRGPERLAASPGGPSCRP